LSKAELDGILLSDFEMSLVRIERARVKFIEERTAKRAACKHSFTKYLGHGHNDETYECVHCGETQDV